MARRERTFWETKPHKPIRYGLLLRLADWRAGRSDGKSGIPPLPPISPDEMPAALITPYLEPLYQSYRGSTDAENLAALRDVADALVRRRILQRDIAEQQERSLACQKQLEAMPDTPDETILSQRNSTEQHADPLLVRTRRLREYAGVRMKAQAAKDQSDERVLELLAELARLSETMSLFHPDLGGYPDTGWSRTACRLGAWRSPW
jgi:hypothetical protein